MKWGKGKSWSSYQEKHLCFLDIMHSNNSEAENGGQWETNYFRNREKLKGEAGNTAFKLGRHMII